LTIHQGIDTHFMIRSKADFEMVFREHYAVLCSYANQFLKDTDLSEEVVQEVMVKLWTQRATIVIESSVRSYLFRAVRNGCMNHFKHQEVRKEYQLKLDQSGRQEQPSAEDALIISELDGRIRVAIGNLPTERQKIFILSRYEGLTYLQIADKLKISVKTVENQMGKALKTLREELSDYLPWIILFYSHFFKP
jgi:RNA polymerase sigma-70 factor (ECF subfamily)